MTIDDISTYKQKTMERLIEDPDVLVLIKEPEIVADDPSELIYENIFPYKRIQDTQEETKCFILVTVDVPKVSTRNYFFKDMLLMFTIISHKNIMKTSFGGTRNDLMSGAINRIFNGNKDYSGRRLELVSNIEGTLTGGDYMFREMRFNTQDSNTPSC